jgi:NAD(P)-dependent dehydrogenase (short-subunit alcohol dehydrogenase family)
MLATEKSPASGAELMDQNTRVEHMPDLIARGRNVREGYPPDDWDKVVAVNLTAMFDVTRLAIPHLKKSAAGVIINMTSIAGRFGFKNRSPYAPTKWGVIGFTIMIGRGREGFGWRAIVAL